MYWAKVSEIGQCWSYQHLPIFIAVTTDKPRDLLKARPICVSHDEVAPDPILYSARHNVTQVA